MDNKIEILLGSEKNINSVNVDNYNKIELTNKESEITEFTVNDVVNATELFDTEREDNPVYRIYGRIEYMSLLNGLKDDYNEKVDFFNPQKTGNFKDIFNSFDFYLVAPSSGATYHNISNTNKFRRSFDVIADKNDFELYNGGFSKNVYGEQTYIFSFKKDFDVSNLYDKFGFPVTELFLYIQYKKSNNGADITEKIYYNRWSISTGNKSKIILDTKDLNVGDSVEANNGYNVHDIIEYNKEEYLQEQVDSQKFYVRTYYNSSSNIYIEWNYNPFIPFRLRYLDDVVSTAKLSNIVESGTTLNVYKVNTPTTSINVTKSLKQNISETTKSIIDWDGDPINSGYGWNPSTGILRFFSSGLYNINFKTQIYLSEATDKYIAETYLQESTNGTTWTNIPNTTRKYLITNTTEGTIVEQYFSVGNRIRVRVRLIPNPDERKLEIIPDFATIIEDDGKYVWRDIVPQGYIDPLTDIGVDYPFLNGKRYLFSPIILDVIPNLNNTKTASVFNEIAFSDDADTIDKTPITELDDIGKPCQ